MQATTKTKSPRRLEKRQVIILLLLVLAVCLAGFALGVVVGRRGTERALAQKLTQVEKVLVAQVPQPASEPETMTAASVDKAEKPTTEESGLSFYNDLSKESVPLGSGINLAPVKSEPTPAEPARPPIDLPDQPIVKKPSPPVTVAQTTEPDKPSPAAGEMPKVAPDGAYSVQIGSFGGAGDAIALKQKFFARGYPVFVAEADLGAKGRWYRVRIGPYADVDSAKMAQKILEDKEQLKGFVSRH